MYEYRYTALHNIQIICPIIAVYLSNTYRHPARLFIQGGGEILSKEGTTQGDPLAMPWFSINTTIIIQRLRNTDPEAKQVWLADDACAGGKVEHLHSWFQHLRSEGNKHGYYVNSSKTWLIMKSKEIEAEAKQIFGNSVNIIIEGKRHLGAVLGTKEYKDEYCKGKVDNWLKELNSLCDIAISQPQAAFTAYTKGYRPKFTYVQRTIEDFGDYLTPIEELLANTFIPTLFGRNYAFPSCLRSLFTLPPREGGLGITSPAEESKQQFEGSIYITKPHVEAIVSQEQYIAGNTINELKQEHLQKKSTALKKKIVEVDLDLPPPPPPPEVHGFAIQARDKGASTWLTALPLREQGFDLNKEQFRDALSLRYNIPLEGLPSTCACGDTFNVVHALSCKKGGFVAMRHDSIRDILTSFLGKVCKDVQSEPHLIPLENEVLHLNTANRSEEARLDIKANGFWQHGQTSFFDIRVTHVNAMSNRNKSTKAIFRNHELAKKREYMERVLEVERGTFTPLVMGTNGGMGEKCSRFLSQLANKLAAKQNEIYNTVITWIRTKLSYEILRSAVLCVRGSRTLYKSGQRELTFEFTLDSVGAGIV